MTFYVAHRQNDLKNLTNLKSNKVDSIEIDLRDKSKEIILSHDPFKNGPSFLKNIDKLKDFFLIVDIKSTGFSEKICKLLKKKKIKFLLLNLIASEQIYLINKKYSKNIFIRYSSIEKPDLTKKYFRSINWVWFDFFDKKFISKQQFNYLKKFNKKICITSPDLLGFKKIKIINYIKYLNKNNIKIDMVCSKLKFINLWKKYYKF